MSNARISLRFFGFWKGDDSVLHFKAKDNLSYIFAVLLRKASNHRILEKSFVAEYNRTFAMTMRYVYSKTACYKFQELI